MKVLLTIKEYAKKEGLSEIAVRKRVSSNYTKSINFDKTTYVVYEDNQVEKLKIRIKNSNAKIRELKLKLEVKNSTNDERYIEELNKQIDKLETKLEKKNKKIDKLQDQKDTMYEKFLGTLVNQKILE